MKVYTQEKVVFLTPSAIFASRGFEVVHRKPSSASTKRSKSSGAGDPVERGVCSKKRVS